MLYFKSLVEPMADLPEGDQGIRSELAQQMADQGLVGLVAQLAQVDPVAHARIDLANPQRVQRALEVFRVSGRPISAFWAEGTHDGRGNLAVGAAEQFPYRLLQYGVIPQDRAILHARIAQRFRWMLEQGFEQEVRELYSRGDLHLDLPSMRCVGYRQMWHYLDGLIDYDEMIERGIIAPRPPPPRYWLLKAISCACSYIRSSLISSFLRALSIQLEQQGIGEDSPF